MSDTLADKLKVALDGLDLMAFEENTTLAGTVKEVIALGTQAVSALREVAELREAVESNLPYLENLILPYGHESGLLGEHPAPCQGHDFCLMRQAQKGADAIRAILKGKP